jgi:hypothetical protein
MVIHDSETPTPGHVGQNLLIADEIECGGKGIGGSGQEK